MARHRSADKMVEPISTSQLADNASRGVTSAQQDELMELIMDDHDLADERAHERDEVQYDLPLHLLGTDPEADET